MRYRAFVGALKPSFHIGAHTLKRYDSHAVSVCLSSRVLTALRRRFADRIYKYTPTLRMRSNGVLWLLRAVSLETAPFFVSRRFWRKRVLAFFFANLFAGGTCPMTPPPISPLGGYTPSLHDPPSYLPIHTLPAADSIAGRPDGIQRKNAPTIHPPHMPAADSGGRMPRPPLKVRSIHPPRTDAGKQYPPP